MKKATIALLILCIIGLTLVGCGQSYTEEDINISYEEGYAEGYDIGCGDTFAPIQDQITGLESQLVSAQATIEAIENDRAIRQNYNIFLNTLFSDVIYDHLAWKIELEEKAEATGDSRLIASVDKLFRDKHGEDMDYSVWWVIVRHCLTRLCVVGHLRQ